MGSRQEVQDRARARSTASKRYTRRRGLRARAEDQDLAKFDETVDLAVRLGVDPKHADQMVRGAVVLPHGTGKTRARRSSSPRARRQGGARGRRRLRRRRRPGRRRSTKGFWTSTRVIATPDMMGLVGKLGRVLGPRGLMPNPKVGTVTFDVAKAVREAKAGKVEYRVEKAGIVHARIGKVSFGERDARATTRARSSTRSCSPSRRRPRAPTSKHHGLARRWARASRSTRCSSSASARPRRR